MADTITELTPEQEAMLDVVAAEWKAIGECPDKADLERCKEIIPRVYIAADLIPPTEILLADGPVHAAEMARQLDQQVDRENLHKTLQEYIGDQVYGNHDAPWLAFYAFMLDQCHMEICEPLRPLIDLAKHCGWWGPYDTRAIVQHRCTRFLRDEEERLHCEDGPSVAWPDGTKLWDIHGIEVDEQIVMRPETQTVEQINKEESGDVRSIRIERFGWVRYLKETSARLIHNRKNEVEGTLEALYQSPTGENRLVVTCPTGRLFSLGVPAAVTTCEQAANWLQGDKPFNIVGRT